MPDPRFAASSRHALVSAVISASGRASGRASTRRARCPRTSASHSPPPLIRKRTRAPPPGASNTLGSKRATSAVRLSGGCSEIPAQAVDHRQREIAMSDGRTEGALPLGTLHVHVYPLVAPAEAGKGVDVLLGDLAPLARPDLAAEELPQPVDPVRHCLRHGRG